MRVTGFLAHQWNAESVYVRSALVWRLCSASYWMLFFYRVTIDVGLDPLQLVLLGTAKEISILLAEIPTGALADLKSRRLSVIVAFTSCGVAIVGAGLATGYVLLLATQVAWAVGSTFRSGADTAWLTDEIGVPRAQPVIVASARHQAVGGMVGVAASAALAWLTTAGTAIVVIGATLLVWSVVLTLRMGETGFEPTFGARFKRFSSIIVEASRSVRGAPMLRILVVATFCQGFASEAVDRLYIARFDELGFPTLAPVMVVGALIVAHSLLTLILLRPLGPRLTEPAGLSGPNGPTVPTVMASMQLVVAIGVGVLALTGAFWVGVVAFVVLSAVRSLTLTGVTAWTNLYANNRDRATVHSFVGQTHSLGEVSGGVALGLLASAYSLGTALAASACVYLLAALVTRRGASTSGS